MEVENMPDEKTVRTRVYQNPVPTTDLIIEYNSGEKEGIVLITRRNKPYGIALPGGFAEMGISLGTNAKKEAREETGLEVIIGDEDAPFCVRSDPKRDPRGHMMSVVYVGQGYGKLKAGDDAKTANLYSLGEVYALMGRGVFAFDHEQIVGRYLQQKGYDLSRAGTARIHVNMMLQ